MNQKAHGGDVWGLKNEIIDFSANINPLGLLPRVKEVIAEKLDALLHYPEPDSKSLKRALASFHNVHHNNLLIGNGSIEFIYLMPKALQVKKILVPTPSFSEYEFAAKANGAAVFFAKSREEKNFRIDIAKLKKFIPRVDLIFLCNPNNPTGSLLSSEELLSLFDLCVKYRVILVIDEAFIDFVSDSERMTLMLAAVGNKYLLVLRSLTKFFALAGLRLGYLAGHKEIISRISQFQYPWNVNSLAQAAGEEVIKDKEYIKQSRDFIFKEREYLADNLNGIERIKVYPSSANFLLCKLRDLNASALKSRLLKRGILIRDCGNFRGLGDKFFRVAVRKREENVKLIEAMKSI